jgi:hypothetical protein
LNVVETRRETAQVEVEFPVFRRRVTDHAAQGTTPGSTVVVSERWDANGELWSIKHVRIWGTDRDTWRISRDHVPLQLPQPHREADFALGRGKHALTAQDFNRSLSGAKAFLMGVPAI